MDKVMHESLESQVILQRMEEVRCELDEDVQEIVESVRVMGQWQYYVKTYPWICVGAALVAGYLIMPRRTAGTQPDARTPADLADRNGLFVAPVSLPRGSVRGAVLTFAGNLILRGVLSYAGRQAGKFLAARTAPKQPDERP